MILLLQNLVYGCVDAAPLGEQLVQDFRAIGRQKVEALLAFVLLAPLAGQKALGFQAAEQWVEGAFVDLQAVFGQGLAQSVAVLLAAQGRQDCQNQATAA